MLDYLLLCDSHLVENSIRFTIGEVPVKFIKGVRFIKVYSFTATETVLIIEFQGSICLHIHSFWQLRLQFRFFDRSELGRPWREWAFNGWQLQGREPPLSGVIVLPVRADGGIKITGIVLISLISGSIYFLFHYFVEIKAALIGELWSSGQKLSEHPLLDDSIKHLINVSLLLNVKSFLNFGL